MVDMRSMRPTTADDVALLESQQVPPTSEKQLSTRQQADSLHAHSPHTSADEKHAAAERTRINAPVTMTPATADVAAVEEPPRHVQQMEMVDLEQAPATPSSGDIGSVDPLPPLHTPHRRRKILTWIGIGILTLDLAWLPITYYYALKYGAHMKTQDILAVITAVYGMISFCHYFLRSMKLFRSKSSPHYRPVGWTRWGFFEFLHINFILAISIVELELIIGTIPEKPWVRLVAMASPTLCYWFGTVLLISSFLTIKKKVLPFNMSSTPKGTLWRPAMLALIEDAGSIEANGGVLYRTNCMKRYEVSPIFRRMILHLSIAWGIILLSVAIASTILIALLHEDIGFGVGWGLPYATSIVCAVFTMVYVRRELIREARLWPTKGPIAGPVVQ